MFCTKTRFFSCQYVKERLFFIYSIGRIMLSIKAISSDERLYFLYNFSSVQGFEKS